MSLNVSIQNHSIGYFKRQTKALHAFIFIIFHCLCQVQPNITCTRDGTKHNLEVFSQYFCRSIDLEKKYMLKRRYLVISALNRSNLSKIDIISLSLFVEYQIYFSSQKCPTMAIRQG